MNNILIGDRRTVSRIFEKVRKSYDRMNGYYSGEIHIIDNDIIPNSRRDYFEDNEAWRAAEQTLVDWARPLVKRVYDNVDERKRGAELVERDADRILDDVEREASEGFATEAHRARAVEKLREQEEKITKAITAERTPEEAEVLRLKKEEAARKREEIGERPKPLVDESRLNRDERKIMRMVLEVVDKELGPAASKKVAAEVDKRLKRRREKKS